MGNLKKKKIFRFSLAFATVLYERYVRAERRVWWSFSCLKTPYTSGCLGSARFVCPQSSPRCCEVDAVA